MSHDHKRGPEPIPDGLSAADAMGFECIVAYNHSVRHHIDFKLHFDHPSVQALTCEFGKSKVCREPP